jgi:hypothetical protein
VGAPPWGSTNRRDSPHSAAIASSTRSRSSASTNLAQAQLELRLHLDEVAQALEARDQAEAAALVEDLQMSLRKVEKLAG